MTPRNLSLLLAGLLTLGLFGSLVGACTYDEAKYYCVHGDPAHPEQGGFSGPGLEGCIVGAHEVGPMFNNVAASDAECERRFDVKSIPYAANAHWMDQTSEMIDRRNGCHYGAKGHMRAQLILDGGSAADLDAGCLEQMDAGGNISCVRPSGSQQ